MEALLVYARLVALDDDYRYACGGGDFIYSIGNGGYMAALDIALSRAASQRGAPPGLWLCLAAVISLVVLPLSLVYDFGVHSFVATSVGSLVALAIVLGARPDLTSVAVVTGPVGTLLAIPVAVQSRTAVA